MIKLTTISIATCDSCGTETGHRKHCLKCGKHFCYQCQKDLAIEYAESPHFSGSNDGLYCLDCHRVLLVYPDLVFLAYRKIAELMEENRRLYKDLTLREKEAEAHLKTVLGIAQ